MDNATFHKNKGMLKMITDAGHIDRVFAPIFARFESDRE